MFIDPGDFTAEALARLGPECGECGPSGAVALVSVETIYPNRRDLWQREDGSTPHFWLCSCGAYCGSHRNSLKALGSPANRDTRTARQAAHTAFDRLWKAKARKEDMNPNKARGKGYKWLAEQMGIDPKKCHIGHMTAAEARRVVELCQPFHRRRKA